MKIQGKSAYIGIDVGATTIKAVEIELGLNGEAVLRKANVVARSEGIKRAVSDMSLKKAKAIGIVDCPATCVRYITVPKMPDKELPEAVKWELKDKITFSLDEAAIDYEVQREVEEDGVKKLRVEVAASPLKTRDTMMNLISTAGAELVSLIEPPLAIEHLSRYLNLNRDDAVAFIDLGLEITELVIIKNNALKFYRKINSGGAAITKAMTAVLVSEEGRFQLDSNGAETLKIRYGIPKEATPELVDGKVSKMQLVSLIRPATERLLQEIEHSFEYYKEESGGDKVKSVVLFGGTANLKGLTEFLADNLGVPVAVGNPLEKIEVAGGAMQDIKVFSHMFSNAVGAALSGGKGINLMPSEIKEKGRRDIEKASVKAIAVGVITVLILVFIGLRIQHKSYEDKIRYGKDMMNSMAPQLEATLNYERLQDKLTLRNQFIEARLLSAPDWEEVFRELSNKVPKEVVFSEISMNNNELIIKGSISGVSNREEALSNLIAAIEGGLFKKVSLVNAKIGEDIKTNSEFEIKCTF